MFYCSTYNRGSGLPANSGYSLQSKLHGRMPCVSCLCVRSPAAAAAVPADILRTLNKPSAPGSLPSAYQLYNHIFGAAPAAASAAAAAHPAAPAAASAAAAASASIPAPAAEPEAAAAAAAAAAPPVAATTAAAESPAGSSAPAQAVTEFPAGRSQAGGHGKAGNRITSSRKGAGEGEAAGAEGSSSKGQQGRGCSGVGGQRICVRKAKARPYRLVRPSRVCPMLPRRHSLLLRLLKQALGG
eukprot:scaffold78092_cov16-Tisochrysis_lutea.AAC.1